MYYIWFVPFWTWCKQFVDAKRLGLVAEHNKLQEMMLGRISFWLQDYISSLTWVQNSSGRAEGSREFSNSRLYHDRVRCSITQRAATDDPERRKIETESEMNAVRRKHKNRNQIPIWLHRSRIGSGLRHQIIFWLFCVLVKVSNISPITKAGLLELPIEKLNPITELEPPSGLAVNILEYEKPKTTSFSIGCLHCEL